MITDVLPAWTWSSALSSSVWMSGFLWGRWSTRAAAEGRWEQTWLGGSRLINFWSKCVRHHFLYREEFQGDFPIKPNRLVSRQCHRLPIYFLTSDLTIRNKNKRTLIVIVACLRIYPFLKWTDFGGSEKAKILKLGMNNSQNIARREARY